MSPHDSWGAMPAQHEEPYEPTATEYDRLGAIQDEMEDIAKRIAELEKRRSELHAEKEDIWNHE